MLPALHSGHPGLAALGALGLASYTAVVAMTLWCYLACVLADPGHVPPGWHPFQDAQASACCCAFVLCCQSCICGGSVFHHAAPHPPYARPRPRLSCRPPPPS